MYRTLGPVQARVTMPLQFSPFIRYDPQPDEEALTGMHRYISSKLNSQ